MKTPNQSEYSLYTYTDGSLRVFGRGKTRKKFATIEEALVYARQYYYNLCRISSIQPVTESFRKAHQKQLLVVEYTGAYQSRIVGVVNDNLSDIETFHW